VEIRAENGENEEEERKALTGRMGGNVNRILKAIFATALCGTLAGAGALLAQDAAKPDSAKKSGSNSAAVARGKSLFQQKCSLCHYDTSDQKKIGPGLKGLSKRGTFSANGNKITDESLKTWIENGDQLMPPFKDVLEPAQIKDVITYVKML
jgi:cytochrome c